MDYAQSRHNMVEGQVRPNKVTDQKLIDAMEELPRERFVPDALKGIAYSDGNLRLEDGRGIIAPMVVARMFEALNVDEDEAALVVGCGVGYEAAIMARLASAVVAVESHSGLINKANKSFNDLGIDTVAVVEGEMKLGAAKQGPYDVIFINGAVEEVPEGIFDQLAEGGRLAVILTGSRIGKVMLYGKDGGIVSGRELFEASAPALPGFEKNGGFVF